MVDQVRHQGAVAAKQISRQANVASRAVQENPIPVIVALGTIALISALIFTAQSDQASFSIKRAGTFDRGRELNVRMRVVMAGKCTCCR